MLIVKNLKLDNASVVIEFSNGETCTISGEEFRILSKLIIDANMPKNTCGVDPELKAKLVKQRSSPPPTINLINPLGNRVDKTP